MSDDIEYASNTLSQHQQLPLESVEYKNYLQNLVDCLSIFHRYAVSCEINYGLMAGSLIGYYWNQKIIPWDDDIDLWDPSAVCPPLMSSSCSSSIHKAKIVLPENMQNM